MTDTTLTKTVIFSVPRETVWSFLVDKNKLAKWFHPAEQNLAAGEDFSLYGTNDDGEKVQMCWGEVLEMREPELLKYTFTVKPLGGKMTTVIWELEALANGTKLTLTHQGLGDGDEASMGLMKALDAGWDKHFSTLRSVV